MNSVEEAIERLGDNVDASVVNGLHAAYRIETEEGGDWTFEVSDGRLSLDGHQGQPDCTIRGDEDDLAHIFRGERDLLTAMLQGRVEMKGDVQLAQRLVALLRSQHA